jgi:hypothetical protein
MQTLERFMKAGQVAMRCQEVAINGETTDESMSPRDPHQYACELYASGGDRRVTAIIGSDNGPPDLSEVLDAVAAEAAVADEARSYEQWALAMGFDPDSRHDERVFRTVRRRARLLRQLLGDDRYEQLLWQTERL